MKKRKARYIAPSEEFGGFGWLGEADPTPEQMELVYFLARWAHGTHHFNGNVNQCGKGVTLTRSETDMSTFDGDKLTWLVLLAHKYHVRVEIEAAAPRYIRIHCHQRRQDGDRIWERHPGLDGLIERAEALK